jgi:cation transport ATPase
MTTNAQLRNDIVKLEGDIRKLNEQRDGYLKMKNASGTQIITLINGIQTQINEKEKQITGVKEVLNERMKIAGKEEQSARVQQKASKQAMEKEGKTMHYRLLFSILTLVPLHFVHRSFFLPYSEASRRLEQLVSDFLEVVWYGVATFAGWFFGWSWIVQSETKYPDITTGLYVLILPVLFKLFKFLCLEIRQLVQRFRRNEGEGGTYSTSGRRDDDVGCESPSDGSDEALLHQAQDEGQEGP